MLWSKLLVPTLRETPAEAEAASHRLLLRGGYIRQLGAGLYSLLPLGQRVVARITGILREEMERIGAQEFYLPALHPADLWKESGRWAEIGDEMFRLVDRRRGDYCLGMTHEEIFTALARDELRSYRQLPQRWFQIQSKFRDEPRPKGGPLRARQFTMKDSYSFDVDAEGLARSFELHAEAYRRIFARCAIPTLPVEASSGAMGGSESVEFMALVDAGEDWVATCPGCGYAANLEKARSRPPEESRPADPAPIEAFATPGIRTIDALVDFPGGAPAERQIKTLVYTGPGGPALFLVRGDDVLNEVKLASVTGTSDMRPAQPDEIRSALGASAGSLGAVGVSSLRIYADLRLRGLCGMTTGANQDDLHLRHVDVARDIPSAEFVDLREVQAGETCIHCESALETHRAWCASTTAAISRSTPIPYEPIQIDSGRGDAAAGGRGDLAPRLTCGKRHGLLCAMQLGLDRVLSEGGLLSRLRGRRVALVANPASMTSFELGFEHALDALVDRLGDSVTAAFGPQHGMRGDKQYNMEESETYLDPRHGIPVFSLYGEVRRPTDEALAHFDLVLFDLQDVGWRGYTFVATLLYMLEACARAGKEIWVLDRPNPAGRAVEGLRLVPGEESFVGVVPIPQRHGLTLGELARYMVEHFSLDVALEVVAMTGYRPDDPPGFGWDPTRVWVNPSPAITNLNSVRCFPGTVLLEGTHLSEGRGTTTPLEVFGAPDLPVDALLAHMRTHAPEFLTGCRLRPCFFEPFFDKHTKDLCAGVQIHADFPGYDPDVFRPYRLVSALLKAMRAVAPERELWRDFYYEYEPDRRPIDVIHGGPALREWVDDPHADAEDWERRLAPDEVSWREERERYLLYP